MIAGDKDVFIFLGYIQMTAPHSLYFSRVEPAERAVLFYMEGDDAFVSYGIKYPFVMGQSKIRRVVHLNLGSFSKMSPFHIYIIYGNALGFSGIGIRTHIGNIFFFINIRL